MASNYSPSLLQSSALRFLKTPSLRNSELRCLRLYTSKIHLWARLRCSPSLAFMSVLRRSRLPKRSFLKWRSSILLSLMNFSASTRTRRPMCLATPLLSLIQMTPRSWRSVLALPSLLPKAKSVIPWYLQRSARSACANKLVIVVWSSSPSTMVTNLILLRLSRLSYRQR